MTLFHNPIELEITPINPNTDKTFFNFTIEEEITPDYILHLINKEMQYEEATFIRLQIMCGNSNNKDTVVEKQNLKDAYASALCERKRLFDYIINNHPSAQAESLMNKYTIIVNNIKSYSPHHAIYQNKDQENILISWKAYSALLMAITLICATLFIFK